MIADKFAAGTTFAALLTLTAHPATEWGLELIMRGPMAIDITGAPVGTQHALSASAAVTSEWQPGVYWWALRATQGAEVVQVDEGQITISPDLALVTGTHDGRTHAERTLAAIEAVIEKRATTDQQKYTINNRELWRTPIAELLRLRGQYRDEVAREKMKQRTGQSLLGRQVKVRF